MGQISIIWEVLIRDAAEFHEAKTPLLEQAAQKGGIARYEYFLHDDGKTCHVLEVYENSDAALYHLNTLGEFGERFIANIEPNSMALNVYGDPAPELRELLGNIGAKFFASSGSIADIQNAV